MNFEHVIQKLEVREQVALRALKRNAENLLDCAPRFKYFTLHGKEHLESLFNILGILLESGLVLGNRDLYLLSMAICTHDLGMVLPLKSYTDDEVLKSNHSVTDPVHFENYVRDIHHLVIGRYF